MADARISPSPELPMRYYGNRRNAGICGEGGGMIKATFDEQKWKSKIDPIQSQIEDLVEYYAVEVKRLAQEQLDPIYTDRRKWPVSGALRRDITVESATTGNFHKRIIFNELPYARIRHFENRAHPSTIGYFSKPLFKVRGPLKRSLNRLYKGGL